MKSLRITFAAVSLAICGMSMAQEIKRTPLEASHPLIGIWRIDFSKLKCFEEYELRSDGTKLSRSGEERNEAEFEISAVPSTSGFYRWVDKITKGNAKPDCHGQKTEVGHVAVSYVRLHPTGQRFLLCEAEDVKTCFAEFTRKVL